MTEHRLEVADVFREYGSAYLEAYGHATTLEQKRVMKNIVACRTAALGGHKLQCDHCDHDKISYNSCRNRHCPKCQAAATARWLEAKETDLLPVPYFHVVFTLPDKLRPVALQNKRAIYDMLFRAASETLLQISRDPKHLGAGIGFLAVLHTWGQNLLDHPHLHCVIPGGGIALDGSRWVSCRKEFFLPIRVLSCLFRGKFMAYLKAAFETGTLEFHGKCQDLADPSNWRALVSALWESRWVVYAKAPFGGPQQVLKYLARYTHRVAISNRRLLTLADGKVTFQWKDYRNGNHHKTMTLEAVEFIRRFLLHVLPKGFVRIRQYGFLANPVKSEKLVLCRKLLGQAQKIATATPQSAQQAKTTDTCPVCRKGRMIIVAIIEPQSPVFDTS